MRALHGAGVETAGEKVRVAPASSRANLDVTAVPAMPMQASERVAEKSARRGIEDGRERRIGRREDVPQWERLPDAGNDGSVHEAVNAVLGHVTGLAESLRRHRMRNPAELLDINPLKLFVNPRQLAGGQVERVAAREADGCLRAFDHVLEAALLRVPVHIEDLPAFHHRPGQAALDHDLRGIEHAFDIDESPVHLRQRAF